MPCEVHRGGDIFRDPSEYVLHSLIQPIISFMHIIMAHLREVGRVEGRGGGLDIDLLFLAS